MMIKSKCIIITDRNYLHIIGMRESNVKLNLYLATI